MTRTTAKQGLHLSIFVAVAYVVFLASSAPHRVHHFFDTPLRNQHARAANDDPASGSHHHHQYSSDDSHRHSRDHSGQDSTAASECLLLAAFDQHPSSIAEPAVLSTARWVVRSLVQRASWPPFAIRVGPYRTRSPPTIRHVPGLAS